jgi:hypothetical protein
MNLTLNLPDELADRLRSEAERLGVDVQQCAVQMIQNSFPTAERARALRQLFSEWAAEDATDDPAELARRQNEWAELKHALNANRASGRKLFPE